MTGILPKGGIPVSFLFVILSVVEGSLETDFSVPLHFSRNDGKEAK
ncbi:hypothetical protein BCL90_1986 [Pedobacter alluvionis]|uniref:Uncharacterized protein n=1 Tax=Pedobacter alluvionis TaxID=475253 RepID=A0A497Y2D9_9SPHI|nr:hypothetical protein BCL90_1986 [Pedobacter alluvionis]